MVRRNNSILSIIIILLVLMIPLSSLSIFLHINQESNNEGTNKNPNNIVSNQEPVKYQNGSLYFYDNNTNLIGSYTCQKDPCSYAKSTIDDSNYPIDYLKNQELETNVINDSFVFINDNNKILLYDIKKKETIKTYKAINNYNNAVDPTLMLVLNDENKWGVISITNEVEEIIPHEYDFIGLIKKDNLVNTEYFVVKKDSLWGLIDQENSMMSNYLSYAIVSYNDLAISLQDNQTYYVYDYNGKRLIDQNGFNYVSFTEKLINIIDKNNNFYVYDLQNGAKVTPDIPITSTDYANSFTSYINGNVLEITVEGNSSTYDLAI